MVQPNRHRPTNFGLALFRKHFPLTGQKRTYSCSIQIKSFLFFFSLLTHYACSSEKKKKRTKMSCDKISKIKVEQTDRRVFVPSFARLSLARLGSYNFTPPAKFSPQKMYITTRKQFQSSFHNTAEPKDASGNASLQGRDKKQ